MVCEIMLYLTYQQTIQYGLIVKTRFITILYARSDWTLKSKYPPLFTFWHSCLTVRALFFRYIKVFLTILEHLKLKFSISIHRLGKY